MKRAKVDKKYQRVQSILFLVLGLFITIYVFVTFRLDFGRLLDLSGPTAYIFIALFFALLKMLFYAAFPKGVVFWWLCSLLGLIFGVVFAFFPVPGNLMESIVYKPDIPPFWFVLLIIWMSVALFWGLDD